MRLEFSQPHSYSSEVWIQSFSTVIVSPTRISPPCTTRANMPRCPSKAERSPS